LHMKAGVLAWTASDAIAHSLVCSYSLESAEMAHICDHRESRINIHVFPN
jgi:hypothetical protein